MEAAMPVIKKSAKPPHEHPELVAALADELRNPHTKGGAGIPDITEESQTFGGRIHVLVLWDRWQGVPQAQRGPIILDAYRQVRGEREMLQISQPLGFTIEEWRRFQASAQVIQEP
jgi:hypothetical protein